MLAFYVAAFAIPGNAASSSDIAGLLQPSM